ncbi:MAG: hypothetical protein H0T68_09435 [Gemmatimonadales bacterium]|nr:hypothetical protein [Gemmatimonadales bacterium]
MGTALKWTTALSVGLLAACGTEGSERIEAAGALKRDITLQSAAIPAVEVASAVELGRAEPRQRRAPRPKRSPEPALTPTPQPAPEAAPTPELAVAPVRVAVAAAELPAPAPSGRELAPGQTVTVLPASAGPGNTGPSDLYLPGEPGRGMFKPGGGACPHPPRRGRPVGIVGFR